MSNDVDLPENTVGKMKEIVVKGSQFLDQQGRQVLLHGISLVNKNPQEGYIFDVGPELFASMLDWGFNVIRLGVIWDGLEPEPGIYNEAYLKRIDQHIEWAKAYGIYVFLDVHQDLYSALYSDGAPEWATLSDGAPHVELGGVWSDAYFTSPAVQTALDNFWANKPASDGVGIQDHYAHAWEHLAERYADEVAVIGYDIMNEPFPGSSAVHSQEMMFAKGAEVITALGIPIGNANQGSATAVSSPVEALVEQWFSIQGRSAILQLLRDVDLYTQIIDVTEPIYAEFEKTQLMQMYHRVAQAIRKVDVSHALFLETTMGSNMGVYSAIEPLMIDGIRDPYQVYAPHGYDLVVDTPDIAQASPERVELIFRRHCETANRLQMPMLVGEWGAYGRNPGTLPAAWHVVNQFEKLLCSETYWAYEPDIETFPCFQAIQRPYPERIAGALHSYHFDPDTGVFQCTWQEDERISSPSRIYLPDWLKFDIQKLHLYPEGDGYTLKATSDGSANSYIVIPPTGQDMQRTLVIKQNDD